MVHGWVRAMKADPEHAAIIAQRTWRGIIARRLFSDLLIASLEARLGPAPAVVPAFDLNEDDQKAPANSGQSPSLKEAQLEAAYNPSVTCFAMVGIPIAVHASANAFTLSPLNASNAST